MFNKNTVNKNHILTYLNYRIGINVKQLELGLFDTNISDSKVPLLLDDFEISDGRMYLDDYTVNIEPITGKFIPFQLTETYYNDVVLHIASLERNDKINKIIKKET
jgi:hypothetical protein